MADNFTILDSTASTVPFRSTDDPDGKQVPHRVIEADAGLAIARGLVAGVSSVNKFGRTENADNGVATDIWDRANTTDNQAIFTAPTQARVHSITSTSTSDDGSPAGVGARTVKIYGLTSWDSAESSETVTLDGTTGVNTASSYVIINRMRVVTCGASGPNVGTIKATAATDSTVTAQINAGEGQTESCIMGVPSTQTAYLRGFYASLLSGSNKTTAANITLLYSVDVENEEAVFRVQHTKGLYDPGTGAISHPYNPPKAFVGPGIIKLQVSADQDNSDVSGGFDLVLVDN